MIITPFDVVSRGQRYTFIDRQALDSETERDQIQQFMLGQLALMQDDAKCEALGLPGVGTIGNLGFGAYRDSALIGVFLITSLDYRSGPWEDLVDWVVINSDPAVFHARPMPGFVGLAEPEALDLAVDATYHMMFRRIESVGGTSVEFSRFSWAIFKNRTDPNSKMAKRIHDHAAADGRFEMTEAPDPNEPALTRVDIELK